MTTPASLPTAKVILEKSTAFLSGKGSASPRLDAEILLAHVLGYDRLRLYLNLDRPLTSPELDQARELIRRRATHEPVAYILGQKEFAGRAFAVGPGVLIPRPDTELLVEHATTELLQRFGAKEGEIRVLELGIGSGAIAVSLACDIPNARITATEIVPAAAEFARRNARTHGVDDRVEVILQDDFSGLENGFHAVVSNPPYIAEEERADLAPDVREHEPAEALFAPDSGLQCYRFLATEAPKRLTAGGFIAVEIGYRQAAAISEIFAAAGLKNIRVVKDYAGHDRVIIADKAGD